MEKVFKITKGLTGVPMHYCPGCTHGIVHRLVAEVLEEMDVIESAIGVSSVGCTYNNYDYFACDMLQAAHGRAPAVATGVKRVHPGSLVFTYQGDGDLAAIGTAEIVHAAARGERITTIFVNNAIYGMTSGQMAPTTLIGQVTTTTPFGRDAAIHGYPIRMSEMLSTLDGAAFIQRVSMHDVRNVREAKKAITKAFRLQSEGAGFTMVEILSTCPTNWGIDPVGSLEWIKEMMIPQYPLGVYKDVTAGGDK
ncbi:MAG: thiamine pyrophosphate-dependent enzyme [Eubacteriales bacterium]|nr:thiamine pyrophosphate-dependent enzyme [Eubacteriales bacterium]